MGVVLTILKAMNNKADSGRNLLDAAYTGKKCTCNNKLDSQSQNSACKLIDHDNYCANLQCHKQSEWNSSVHCCQKHVEYMTMSLTMVKFNYSTAGLPLPPSRSKLEHSISY